MEFDLILSGGRVADGTGAPAYRADVGLQGSRIAAIGNLTSAGAGARLDVSNRVVAPGFIDIHTHSDLSLLVCPTGDSKIRQGVTTEVIGNCGFSPAPVNGQSDLLRVSQSFFGRWVDDIDWNWDSYGDYIGRLRDARPSLNVVPLVGHVTIRTVGMGTEQRPPASKDLEAMQGLVRQSMADGCFGMSTGLAFPPSSYADTDEIVELAKVVSEFDGLYFSHIRGEGETLLRAVAEAIEVGERAHVGVQIAHHKAAFRPNWGRIRYAITQSEWANDRGQDVTFDVYPYTAGSAGLTQIIPDWAHAGGLGALLQRIQAPETREHLRREIAAQGREWDKTILAWAPEGPAKAHEGQSIAQMAEQRRIDPIDALFAALVESNARATMVHFIMSEDDVRYVMCHPLSMFGSDGQVLTPAGPLGLGKPHPRNYGCYARVLGHYVRDEGLLTIEQAIHKAAFRPAEKLGLKQKGRIQAGADADLVVFNPATVREEATYLDPHRFPTGIDHVLVAGQVTVRDGEHTGARAGQVLRKTA